MDRVGICISQAPHFEKIKYAANAPSSLVELLVIDEAERLSTTTLEYVRDLFDRTNIGLILIGMPGIEKRMARYPQLYSRVGFAHHYRPLHGDELSFVLTNHWRLIRLSFANKVSRGKSGEQFIVICMTPDPKPLNTSIHWNTKCSVTQAYSDATKCSIFNGFKL
jgi:hypothetical protein